MNKFCESYTYSTSNLMELITTIILLGITGMMFWNASNNMRKIQSSVNQIMNPITEA